MKKLLLAMLLTSTSVMANGQSIYSQCIGCHGASGEGGVGPVLKGQSYHDIKEKLSLYKNGTTRGPMSSLMIPMAQGLSESDIDEVSKYISSLK